MRLSEKQARAIIREEIERKRLVILSERFNWIPDEGDNKRKEVIMMAQRHLLTSPGGYVQGGDDGEFSTFLIQFKQWLNAFYLPNVLRPVIDQDGNPAQVRGLSKLPTINGLLTDTTGSLKILGYGTSRSDWEEFIDRAGEIKDSDLLDRWKVAATYTIASDVKSYYRDYSEDHAAAETCSRAAQEDIAKIIDVSKGLQTKATTIEAALDGVTGASEFIDSVAKPIYQLIKDDFEGLSKTKMMMGIYGGQRTEPTPWLDIVLNTMDAVAVVGLIGGAVASGGIGTPAAIAGVALVGKKTGRMAGRQVGEQLTKSAQRALKSIDQKDIEKFLKVFQKDPNKAEADLAHILLQRTGMHSARVKRLSPFQAEDAAGQFLELLTKGRPKVWKIPGGSPGQMTRAGAYKRAGKGVAWLTTHHGTIWLGSLSEEWGNCPMGKEAAVILKGMLDTESQKAIIRDITEQFQPGVTVKQLAGIGREKEDIFAAALKRAVLAALESVMAGGSKTTAIQKFEAEAKRIPGDKNAALARMQAVSMTDAASDAAETVVGAGKAAWQAGKDVVGIEETSLRHAIFKIIREEATIKDAGFTSPDEIPDSLPLPGTKDDEEEVADAAEEAAAAKAEEETVEAAPEEEAAATKAEEEAGSEDAGAATAEPAAGGTQKKYARDWEQYVNLSDDTESARRIRELWVDLNHRPRGVGPGFWEWVRFYNQQRDMKYPGTDRHIYVSDFIKILEEYKPQDDKPQEVEKISADWVPDDVEPAAEDPETGEAAEDVITGRTRTVVRNQGRTHVYKASRDLGPEFNIRDLRRGQGEDVRRAKAIRIQSDDGEEYRVRPGMRWNNKIVSLRLGRGPLYTKITASENGKATLDAIHKWIEDNADKFEVS